MKEDGRLVYQRAPPWLLRRYLNSVLHLKRLGGQELASRGIGVECVACMAGACDSLTCKWNAACTSHGIGVECITCLTGARDSVTSNEMQPVPLLLHTRVLDHFEAQVASPGCGWREAWVWHATHYKLHVCTAAASRHLGAGAA